VQNVESDPAKTSRNKFKAFDIQNRTSSTRSGFDHGFDAAANGDARQLLHVEQAVQHHGGGAFQLYEQRGHRTLETSAVMIDIRVTETFDDAFRPDLDFLGQRRESTFTKLSSRNVNLVARAASGSQEFALLFQRFKKPLSARPRGIEGFYGNLAAPFFDFVFYSFPRRTFGTGQQTAGASVLLRLAAKPTSS
jgi:hypothetical protein